ncbi:MAG TPA: DUF222 domain-containing protein [Actinomycetales bacterium]|nr:DUF222 domain-containing protein [Actinomycetales bacterium]
MAGGRLDAAALDRFVARLGEPVGSADADVDDAALVDEIAGLERVKAASAARQARLTVMFDISQRARQRAAGLPAKHVGKGIAEQVALARRESPSRGARHLREAKALVCSMPHTLAALARGEVGEWTASLAVAETACLKPEDRRRVDAELADRLPTLGPARVGAEAWSISCRLDPEAAVKRYARAVTERRVSLRPAPEAMTLLTALLPVRDGVACHTALCRAVADAAAAGDTRSRGQVMADTLVGRVTGSPAQYAPQAEPSPGQASTDIESASPCQPSEPATSRPDGFESVAEPGQTVEIHLVMTDRALLAGGDEPALLTGPETSGSNPGGGLVPAGVARELVADADKVWVRRLFTEHASGQLVAMESSRRVFDGHLRRMLVLRDGICRTPWCEAPIRHGDHVIDHADGGPTSLDNGQGLCERCNQTKNLPGWSAQTGDSSPYASRDADPIRDADRSAVRDQAPRHDTDRQPGRDPGGGHVVRTTTPTGHVYESAPPPLLGAALQAAAAEDRSRPRGRSPSPAAVP